MGGTYDLNEWKGVGHRSGGRLEIKLWGEPKILRGKSGRMPKRVKKKKMYGKIINNTKLKAQQGFFCCCFPSQI